MRRNSGEIPPSGRRLPPTSSVQRRPSSVETLLNSGSNSQASQSVLSLRKMFLINCLSAVQEPLKTHSVADAYVRSLAGRIEANIVSSSGIRARGDS